LIIKDRNPAEHPEPNKLEAAGAKAEDQMAFYLKRAFGDITNKDVLVFNDLRIANDRGDDFAQIDHLVFYRRGVILIESKSVTSKVRINPQGEWSRLWNREWQGMPSPILQAKRQADFLNGLLQSNKAALRNKKLLIDDHRGFRLCPFDVIVAVSDQGEIDRAGGEYPEVVKAEAVVDKVKEIIARHRMGLLTLSMGDEGLEKFADDEMIRIRDFLKRRHTPIIRTQTGVAVPPPPKPPAPPMPPVAKSEPIQVQQPHRLTELPMKACRNCKGTTVNVEYGKFGYYLKCRDCDGNTPIDFACACGQKARIRKERERFFKECAACGVSVLWHVNK
jgi:hypothetical protein